MNVRSQVLLVQASEILYSMWPQDDVAQRYPQCTWSNVKMDMLAVSATDLLQSTVSKCPWCSINEYLFELSSTTNILHYHLMHNKNTSPPTILEMYVSPACFDRNMFPSKYARRVRPWSSSMLCRWRHWGRWLLAAPATSYSRDLIEYMTADAWSIGIGLKRGD